MRFARGDMRGPHRFTTRSFVWALRSIAVVEAAKNQLLRDFRRRSIFEFCNTITSTADIFLAVLGAINRDAGADFEQTINDEVYEPADAFVGGSISACTENGIVRKRAAFRVHRQQASIAERHLSVAIRRDCVARCWPPVLPRGHCECLMEVFVSPPYFSTDQ
jgi:hypothetical protein